MEMTFRYRIYRIAVYQPAIMIINTQISESGVCCQPLGLKLASLQLTAIAAIGFLSTTTLPRRQNSAQHGWRGILQE
jgi:hypothetical protein